MINVAIRTENPMFDDKLSEEQFHERRSSDLYEALKDGTREEVIDCLKKLDRLDRELIEILVQQLEGSTSSRKRSAIGFNLLPHVAGRHLLGAVGGPAVSAPRPSSR